MKVAVIGAGGYVGRSVVALFETHYEVFSVDPVLNNNLAIDDPSISNCDLAVVCVPTQMTEDGHCDTTIVESVIEKLETPLILIKSTIVPGTTDRLKKKYGKRIVFSPEYIGEGKYFIPFWLYPDPTDMKKHSFQIFGGSPEDTGRIIDIFQKVLGPSKSYRQTTALNAEITKYAENIWGAAKVTWANEMYGICEAIGGDWREVRELWALDERVDKFHTLVFPDKRGWDGKCYPKDLLALIKHSQDAGYQPEFLKEVVKSNARFSSNTEMQELPEKL